jgi:hypothetical protein
MDVAQTAEDVVVVVRQRRITAEEDKYEQRGECRERVSATLQCHLVQGSAVEGRGSNSSMPSES